ncbi:hypothetical protein ABZV29_29395 [Streptomyces sp. NPDC005236]|uniref:hypothetical protein n=1 Tax=Streptomyces sp. NPDC005236 TaxID=3157028 RepID=UPI0033B85BD6
MTDENGQVQPTTATLIRAIGARDTAIGAVMLPAPDSRVTQAAGVCRVAADLFDAVVFGAALSGRQRLKIVGFAAGWVC